MPRNPDAGRTYSVTISAEVAKDIRKGKIPKSVLITVIDKAGRGVWVRMKDAKYADMRKVVNASWRGLLTLRGNQVEITKIFARGDDLYD